MRAFYDILNQVNSIFSSKVIIYLEKNYLEIQRPLIFRSQSYVHQTFKLFGLSEDCPKLT